MNLYRKNKRMSTAVYHDIPTGIRIVQKLSSCCCPNLLCRRDLLFKASVLALTYMAYTCYHMTRKPISVVKSVLHVNCTTNSSSESSNCGYAPFDRPDAQALFGTLDSAFLFFYAGAMFVSGYVAERVSLRYFLSFGMILSAVFTYLIGIAKILDIHSLSYFLIVQAFAGIFQTTGWPGVVSVVGRWFGKSKRGLIFGIWNSHTSVGNILGTLIAAYYVEVDWSLSFIVPSIIMGLAGFVMFLFLADSPDVVGIHQRMPSERRQSSSSDTENANAVFETISNIGSINSEINYRPNERTPILARQTAIVTEQRPISIHDALCIPGVVEFSMCLFFSKLVSYTFLYWLPLYIQSSTTLGAMFSADVSTLFDVGGIIGAIAAGVISDYSGMSATTCAGMLLYAAPALLIYQHYGTYSLPISCVMLVIVGGLVNGPYALITTSVSAELGQHNSLEGNSKALATVTAIIDGTGSIGAAVGPLLAGVISSHGWENVFYMLLISIVIALTTLTRLVYKEFAKLRRNPRIRIE